MLLDVERAVRECRAKAACDADVCAFYLALNACLTSQMHVPRAWLPTNAGAIWEYQTSVLFECPLDNVEAATQESLEREHISAQAIQALTGQEKAAMLAITEEVLKSILGEGIVYYENLRLTPFCTSDILSLSNQYGTHIPSKVINALYKRAAQRVGMVKQYGLMFADDIYRTSVWTRSLRTKIDARWQCAWGSSEAYCNSHREAAIIDSLHLGGELV